MYRMLVIVPLVLALTAPLSAFGVIWLQSTEYGRSRLISVTLPSGHEFDLQIRACDSGRPGLITLWSREFAAHPATGQGWLRPVARLTTSAPCQRRL